MATDELCQTMKQYRLKIQPELGTISSFDGAMNKRTGVDPQAFISLDLLQNGSITAVYEIQGNPDRLVPIIDAAHDIKAAELFNDDGESFNLYLRFDPEPLGRQLLAVVQHHGLVIDMPIPFAADGSLLVTVAGPESAMREAVADVPDSISLELATLDDYDPTEHDLRGVLTERQREIVVEAIARGYYEVPRGTTQEDLAAVFDCTPTTVGNHLRKAEARILTEVFGEP